VAHRIEHGGVIRQHERLILGIGLNHAQYELNLTSSAPHPVSGATSKRFETFTHLAHALSV